MIVTLSITRYTHDDEYIEVKQETDELQLEFGDYLPNTGDRIRHESGRVFRVEWREWLPGGVVLHVTERVQQEDKAA